MIDRAIYLLRLAIPFHASLLVVACQNGDSAPVGCGNGGRELGEKCDEGKGNTTEPCEACCRPDCTQQRCGDGVIDSPAHEACDDANQVDWDGCNDCVMAEVLVNPTPDVSSALPAVGMDGQGNIVVVWSSLRDGDGLGVYGQRFRSDGARWGEAFRVNSTTVGNQNQPAVAVNGSGDFVVVWSSGDIYGQLFDRDAHAVGSEFVINTHVESYKAQPAIGMDDAGNYVVVWQSQNQDEASPNFGIYARRYDSDGASQGNEYRVNTYTQDDQSSPEVSVTPGGSHIVVWQSQGQDGDMYGIYGQRYDAGGSPMGPEFLASAAVPGSQTMASVAAHGDGAFVVSWHSGARVYGQSFDSGGAPAGDAFDLGVSSASQDDPCVAVLSAGGFVVVWRDFDRSAIYGRRFASTAEPASEILQANVFVESKPAFPAIAVDDDRLVVVWATRGQVGSDYDVFAQRYDRAGEPKGSMPW